MNRDESNLESKLKVRHENGNHRFLKVNDSALTDFSSNDYFGLARSPKLKKQIISTYERGNYGNGSTGSRLLTGHSELIANAEAFLSKIFSSEKSLVLSAGYMANLAFFSAVPQRNDLILYDELSHASIKDGIRLSLATKSSFRHNDLDHLRSKLEKHNRQSDVFVAVEAVYSMDGDFALLPEISSICKEYGAKLVVDEAHSTGIWGKNGAGLVCELALEKDVYARIMTFGKAMGIHGACICGSATLVDYMINFSRPFIYTTAISPYEVTSIQTAFEFLRDSPALREILSDQIRQFETELSIPLINTVNSGSPIQSIRIKGNSQAIHLSDLLKRSGFDVRPILSPTVPEGTERLRVCLHTFNSKHEISELCQILNNYF